RASQVAQPIADLRCGTAPVDLAEERFLERDGPLHHAHGVAARRDEAGSQNEHEGAHTRLTYHSLCCCASTNGLRKWKESRRCSSMRSIRPGSVLTTRTWSWSTTPGTICRNRAVATSPSTPGRSRCGR